MWTPPEHRQRDSNESSKNLQLFSSGLLAVLFLCVYVRSTFLLTEPLPLYSFGFYPFQLLFLFFTPLVCIVTSVSLKLVPHSIVCTFHRWKTILSSAQTNYVGMHIRTYPIHTYVERAHSTNFMVCLRFKFIVGIRCSPMWYLFIAFAVHETFETSVNGIWFILLNS